jgi:hypothetical protein
LRNSSALILEANLDRKINVASALMQRLDSGEQLSAVLPPFKTLAGLEADETMQFFFDLLIYGIEDVPGFQPPFHGLAQKRAVTLWMELCKALDIGRITVDSVLKAAWSEKRRERERVITISVSQMEQIQKAPTLQPPVSGDLIERGFKIGVYYQEVQNALHKLRSYAYEYASAVWQKSLKEKDNIALLGPDYRLVIDATGALNSSFADELTAALDRLHSENAANWSLSALGCRNVVLALGSTLWQVKQDQYDSTLLGRTLSLKGDVEKNKLSAYIDAHWKVADASLKPLLKEAHDLVEPIYNQGSKGKAGNKIRRSEAQGLVVDAFRLVNLLQQATNLEPLLTLPAGTVKL